MIVYPKYLLTQPTWIAFYEAHHADAPNYTQCMKDHEAKIKRVLRASATLNSVDGSWFHRWTDFPRMNCKEKYRRYTICCGHLDILVRSCTPFPL